MNRVLTVLLFFVASFGAVILAQSPKAQPGVIFGREWKLVDLKLPPDKINCGPYFVGVELSSKPGAPVEFHFGGMVLLSETPKMFFDPWTRYKTLFDETKDGSPTIEYKPTNSAAADVFIVDEVGILSVAPGVEATIRISHAGYDVASRCLPPPGK